MGAENLAGRAARARELAERLRSVGIRAVALTMVDNAGVTRVKTVPIARFEAAASFGIGLSPVFDVFLVNDHITASAEIGGPVGDLRLMPDLGALRRLEAQPGWAWAPTDQYTQEGEVFACCQRSFTKSMAERAAAIGLTLKMGFEVEWFQARRAGEEVSPVHRGPAYSAIVLADVSDFARDLVVALEAEGVEVLQFHPEYATGQLEVSIAPRDPVSAADENVLLRQTIRGVAGRYGMSASFAPVAIAGEVGNGGHVHFSMWERDRNLFAGGDGPYGMSDSGQAFVAGILSELPALVAIGSPSVASYLRLVPSHWSGPWACWGRENREAAVRFVTGMVGSRETAANIEVWPGWHRAGSPASARGYPGPRAVLAGGARPTRDPAAAPVCGGGCEPLGGIEGPPGSDGGRAVQRVHRGTARRGGGLRRAGRRGPGGSPSLEVLT